MHHKRFAGLETELAKLINSCMVVWLWFVWCCDLRPQPLREQLYRVVGALQVRLAFPDPLFPSRHHLASASMDTKLSEFIH